MITFLIFRIGILILSGFMTLDLLLTRFYDLSAYSLTFEEHSV